MTAYRTEQFDTPAGTYTVELHYDQDSGNPLTEWDQEGMAFFITGNRDGIGLDTLSDAGDAGDALQKWINDARSYDGIQRRFAKWKALTGSPSMLFTGKDFNSYQSYGWFVLVDSSLTYVASDGVSYPAIPDPETIAKGSMSDYRTWAAGEVCGFVTRDPSGHKVESSWGFYDDDDAIEQGKSVAQYDVLDRVRQANHVGAGFIGVI